MLSLDLGIPYDELIRRVPSATFSLYKDLYSRKPWGAYRGDLQAAMVAMTVAAHAGKRREGKVQLTDFLLDFDRKTASDDDPGIDLEAVFLNREKDGGID